MQLRRLLVCVVLIMAPPVSATAQPAFDPPVYVVQQSPGGITVDGRLDEPVWQQAPVMHLRDTRTTELPVLPTTVQCVWDQQHLYIAFHSEDQDIWATMRTPDTEIWREEVVEVFIDADSDQRDYAEFQVNPLGIPVDLWILRHEASGYHQGLISYNCNGYRYAVRVQGTVEDRTDRDIGWDAELAIPFNECITAPHIPPQPGDAWRINFYRMDRAEADAAPVVLAWSPCFSTNHTPSRFGTIMFGTSAP